MAEWTSQTSRIPFLLNLYGTLVPVLSISMKVQSLEAARLLGQGLSKVLSSRSTLLLASSDFSHYLPEVVARREDEHAIEAIRLVDPRGLAEVLETRGFSMCGFGPVMALLTAMWELGADYASLLAYGTSADTSGDTSRVAGYAAIQVS